MKKDSLFNKVADMKAFFYRTVPVAASVRGSSQTKYLWNMQQMKLEI